MANATGESPDRSALWIGFVLSLAVAAGSFWYFTSQAPQLEPVTYSSFDFKPMQIDTQRLAAEREKATEGFAPDESAKAAIEKFQRAVRRANVKQFGSTTPKEIQNAEIEVEFAANEAASRVGGYDHFVYFGDELYHACQTQLENALEAIRKGEVEYETMITAPPPEYEVYREVCGNVLPELVNRGIVKKTGEWRHEYGPALFDILYRYRIASIIRLRERPTRQLTPHGRESMWRWRIQDDLAFPVGQRLRAVERGFEQRLEGDDYPTPLEAAKIYVQASDFRQAHDTLAPWCEENPTDTQLQLYCEFLHAEAEKEGAKKESP